MYDGETLGEAEVGDNDVGEADVGTLVMGFGVEVSADENVSVHNCIPHVLPSVLSTTGESS